MPKIVGGNHSEIPHSRVVTVGNKARTGGVGKSELLLREKRVGTIFIGGDNAKGKYFV